MGNLSFENLTMQFGAVTAVSAVSFEVADGELVVLVGPSGCGKTTLLRMVAGLEQPTSGEIRMNGRRLNDLRPRERNVAMVFQDYALYPHMTVFENIGFGLRARGMRKAETVEPVRRTAEMLGIADLLGRRPGDLSGGQRQRVAMGRAIVRQPEAFLFDEPLSNLDATLRVQMRVEIRRLCTQLATTSLYVTHDQVEAMTMADRIVVLNDGRVQQIGTPEEVYQRPRNRFVAGFIGSPPMNFIEGTVRKTAGGWAMTVGAEVLSLPPSVGERAGEGSVTLGIRPEALMPGEGGAGPFRICGDVVLSELLGKDRILAVETNAGLLKAVVPASENPAGRIVLRCKADDIHLFKE